MHGIGVLGHIFIQFIHISTFNLAVQQESALLDQEKYMKSPTQRVR